MMAKGNTKLIKTVNEGITKLKTEGRFKEIEKQWLGDSIPAINSNSTNPTQQAN